MAYQYGYNQDWARKQAAAYKPPKTPIKPPGQYAPPPQQIPYGGAPQYNQGWAAQQQAAYAAQQQAAQQQAAQQAALWEAQRAETERQEQLARGQRLAEQQQGARDRLAQQEFYQGQTALPQVQTGQPSVPYGQLPGQAWTNLMGIPKESHQYTYTPDEFSNAFAYALGSILDTALYKIPKYIFEEGGMLGMMQGQMPGFLYPATGMSFNYGLQKNYTPYGLTKPYPYGAEKPWPYQGQMPKWLEQYTLGPKKDWDYYAKQSQNYLAEHPEYMWEREQYHDLDEPWGSLGIPMPEQESYPTYGGGYPTYGGGGGGKSSSHPSIGGGSAPAKSWYEKMLQWNVS